MSEKVEAKWKSVIKSRLLIKPPVDSDPRNLSRTMKGIMLVGISLCASTSGFSSTIYFPGLPDVTVDLHAPSIATTLTAALFVLAMGITPIFWASASDHFQMRRFPLMLSILIFGASSIGCAFVNNIWALIVLRCVQSVGSSCGQSVGAGSIADCYPIEQRGTAFGKYFFGVFIGPLLGPIIGGFLIMSPLSWRATFWFCFAFALAIFGYLFFFFPETYRVNDKFDLQLPVVNNNSSDPNLTITYNNDNSPSRSSSSTLNQVTTQQDKIMTQEELNRSKNTINEKTTIAPPTNKRMNPIAPFLLLRHPFIFLASFISGIAFGCMFAVETMLPDLFEQHYGFNAWQTGLSYLGAGIGNLIGSIVNSMLSDRLLLRARRLRGGQKKCEDRLSENLWPAGLICIPLGILLFGWCVSRNLSVWGAIIGFGIQTFGMNQIMTATSAYLVDAMPSNGASATAAANFVRMLMACVLTLVVNPLVGAIGPGYTCVLLAALAYVGNICLVILKWKGEALRRWSGFDCSS
ncbi:major facilitator superfamily domain-containing protein [Cokeromyces recurvatus]|uniref:major facilitator superfamily domain-containing protein n=1 Tax=Cokeromyces recurvatus TaxID=90255 RepID=UPI002220B3F5|nr:major facilitator superfamily domain-containing protein [Cokeromyces recurvatus]KAI7902729.1 major facilitator superfamily domain-containing protein [Cokeromyces recurvatus]